MRTRLFIISVLSLLAFSCTDEKQNGDVIPPIVNGSESFTVQALLETKTSIEGFSTSWVKGDALSIFHNGSSDGKFDLTDAASGSFKGQLASPLESSNDWIAVYPYSDAALLNAYPITIATEQSQSSSSSTAHLAGVSVPLYGKAEAVASDANPVFQMHHLASFVKITVKNTRWYETEINDVELVLEDAALTGNFNVNLSSATMSPVSSQSKVKITLDTPAVIDMDGEVVFYAAIAPLTLPAGKSISLYVNGDLAKSTVFENDITFAPGKVKSISAEYGLAVVVNGVKLEKGVKSCGGVDFNCYSAEISFERAQAVEISGIYQREINRDFFDTANSNTFCAESGTYKVEYYPDNAYMWLYNSSQTYPDCLYILGPGKFAAPKFDDWISFKLDGWLREAPMMVVAPKVAANTYKATMSMSTTNTNWIVLLELYSDLAWGQNGVTPVSLTGDAAARFSLVDKRIKGVDEKTDPFVPGNYEFTFTVAEGGLAVSVQKID